MMVATVKPEQLVKRASQLSSLPMIYTRLTEAVNNPQSTNADISRIVSEDAGLTARLLRLVNSAFFGFPRKIDTIDQAVVVVGTQQLRDLALATSVISMFDAIPSDLVDMPAFWRHSIGCAVTARVIAAHRGERNVERYFAAGVLHDVGRLLLFQQVPDDAKTTIQAARQDKELLYRKERELFGFDHAAVGGTLLHSWQLPLTLEEAVRYHHAPALARAYPLEAAVVHVADIIANGFRDGSSGEWFIPPLDDHAWALLDIPEDGIAPIVSEARSQINDVVQAILD